MAKRFHCKAFQTFGMGYNGSWLVFSNSYNLLHIADICTRGHTVFTPCSHRVHTAFTQCLHRVRTSFTLRSHRVRTAFTLQLHDDLTAGTTGSHRSYSFPVKYHEKLKMFGDVRHASNVKPGLRYPCRISQNRSSHLNVWNVSIPFEIDDNLLERCTHPPLQIPSILLDICTIYHPSLSPKPGRNICDELRPSRRANQQDWPL